MNRQYRYIALIRAINVGGHSIVKMADLRQLFESIGFEEVSTYIQTGNVLFKSGKIDRSKLAHKIEKAIEAESSRKTAVFVLTSEDLQLAAKQNPFNPERFDEEFHSHIVFLSEAPSKDHVKALMAIQGEDYLFKVRGNVFYYAYHRKYEGHTRRNINFEKILGATGTARTYKVVDKLIELAA